LTNKTLVIYHGNCADGFTAAWATWLKHPDWEFHAARYGDPVPDVTGREVYLLDFSYKRPVMVNIIESANHVTVLDHHKTAEAELSVLQVMDPAAIKFECYFDMEKSGARLAWEYFHPLENVPNIVKYVEDRDLWRFSYSNTRPIGDYIFSHAYDFDTWTILSEHIENYEDNCLAQGQAISRQHFKDVDELAINAFRANICGYSVPVINVPYTLASDMCHKLAKNEPFAASFYYDGERGKLIYSLRSTETGVDVSEIAKQMGGGGHAHAAGFEVPLRPLQLGLGEGM
jgi:nanoRNase/pAp phosphatase (c-di-AMP/oligoRNAs hydrolase)